MTTPAPAAPPAPAPAPAAGVPAPAPAPAAPAPAPAAPEATSILGEQPKPKEGEPAKPQAGSAPEKYTDFKLPEGMNLDKPLLEKATTLFKKHGFSQEIAQEFVDFQASNAKALTDSALAAFNDTVKTWAEESKALYGAKAAEEFGIASKAIDRFGPAGFRKLLTESGMGNHPLFVQFCNAVGKQTKEDTPPEGKGAGGSEKSTAELLYPTMKPKT